MTSLISRQPAATDYLTEGVDSLPYGSPEKQRRYATGNYAGAVGRNWYDCDPSLQFLIRYYLGDEAAQWAEPHIRHVAAVMGGPVASLAEETDKHGPELRRYDRWGHEISEVVLPPSLIEARRLALDARLTEGDVAVEARENEASTEFLGLVWSYLLNQADMGLACALGTGENMIRNLVDRFAPQDVRERIMAKFDAGEMGGETAQLLTERTGGSDLATLETTATPQGDAWLLNGLKWFTSNANGQAFVVLAKPVGAPDTIRGIAPFLVLKERRDGSRNGIRVRRLKDKLGTRSVASAEVEFDGAEAFLLSGPAGDGTAGASDGRGMARMMALTNESRLGVAMMGLGCARRALLESICYASRREAWDRRLIDQPLMRRKLIELIVETEAAQALVFDSGTIPNRQRSAKAAEPLRLGAPTVKLQVARLGVTAATDAIEAHGGNGYIEDWPVARILRDAQANTIWEGADNILCLDIRRAIERENADEPFMARIEEALANAGELASAQRAAEYAATLQRALDGWKELNSRDREGAEAGLFELGQAMGRLYAAALLSEQAAWEQATTGATRKELIAQLYAERHLDPERWHRAIVTGERTALERFDEILAGAVDLELLAAQP